MSHDDGAKASESSPQFDADSIRKRLFWSLPETAFMTSVSTRTVQRLLADPDSGFPKARRVRGRVLLSGPEVLRFMDEASD